MSYVTGPTIKTLREKKGYTQKELASLLAVSDKTISKWETSRGLPDITLIEPLAQTLGISVAELLSGECITNQNRSGNLLRSCFHVCPVCGNVIHSTGDGAFSCCGVTLPVLEVEEPDDAHAVAVERIDGEYYVTADHPMRKDHYLSFFACITTERIQMVKLYPEQNAEARFAISGPGILYTYCNKHGLYRQKL